MNKNTGKNALLSDAQTDRLLQAFFKLEAPERLDTPPSQWPELNAGSKRSSREVTLAHAESNETPSPRRSVGRRMAVTTAALAACLMLIAVTAFTPEPGSGPQTAGTQEPAGLEDPEFMNVSEGGEAAGGGSVDDRNTTLEEIEGVDLSPRKTGQ